MTSKLTKYGMMIIAAVLLVGVVFAGAASADYVEVSNWAQLNTAVSGWTETDTARIVAVNASITDRGSGNNIDGINVNGNVILTVNASPANAAGNEAVINGNGIGRLFNIISPGNLTIIGNESSGTVLNLTGGKRGDGGAIQITSGKLTLNTGAKITNCTATSKGGGVFIYENGGGIFTMNGDASITDCSAEVQGYSLGGGVYVGEGGTFTMNGDASITDCKSDSIGGGVNNYGTFTMNNGCISGCTAEGDNGVFGCCGGGVANYGNYGGGTFTMNGGSITDCAVKGNYGVSGGGVHNVAGTFTMNSGSITDCSAEGENSCAGGVNNYGTFNMSGDASISSCNATYGGAYYGGVGGQGGIYKGVFNMKGGRITGCEADDDGGAVYLKDGTTFNMTGGSIEHCEAHDGGAVYIYGPELEEAISPMATASSDYPKFDMSGDACISYCNATEYGGGIETESLATVNISGNSRITNCRCGDGYFGGGIDIYTACTLKISGNVTIKDNKEGTDTNNVYLESNDYLILEGDFDGSIGIAYAGADPAEGEQFGVNDGGYSGAENFFADNADLEGSTEGTALVWKVSETPKPVYKKKSSSQTGYTVILTETQTAVPTVTPTQSSSDDVSVIMPSAKPTAQQTQASPAPFVGLIAGLGIAGLVLRLRK